LVREVIFFAAREAIRNAAKYARTGANDPVDLIIRCRTGTVLTLEIEDNGQGLPSDAGRSRGHGLDLHSLMMTIVGGRLALESTPGAFTRVRLEI
jgi:signal transduction histidine kinase